MSQDSQSHWQWQRSEIDKLPWFSAIFFLGSFPYFLGINIMWVLLSRLQKLISHFRIRFAHSYQNTWPSIFKGAWPKFIFRGVWQSMEWTHSRWGNDRQWVCISIPHWGKVLRQNSWRGFRWRGTFPKWLLGRSRSTMQCYSKSSSRRVIPGWCLWARFRGQVRFGSFIAKWRTGPFGKAGSWSLQRKFSPPWIGLWGYGGFSCLNRLC